ncbi:hypothetical protein CVT26_006459, partial [Gymnopilus dilepis]
YGSLCRSPPCTPDAPVLPPEQELLEGLSLTNCDPTTPYDTCMSSPIRYQQVHSREVPKTRGDPYRPPLQFCLPDLNATEDRVDMMPGFRELEEDGLPELPRNLEGWKSLSDEVKRDANGARISPSTPYRAAWNALESVFENSGLRLWHSSDGVQVPAFDLPMALTSSIINKGKKSGRMNQFLVWNGLTHVASRQGQGTYILRIITAGGQGQDHLRILRRLSESEDMLMCDNHILRMVDEITFQDITIGIFPRMTWDMEAAISPTRRNSVEDVVYMVLQALEVNST